LEEEMMKKIFIGLVLIALLGTSMVVISHTAGDPYITDLIAAQHYDAGNISVWNDGDHLFVKYEGDGWTISETHLHVASDFEDIPQTKKGNPKVGKFDYSGEHDNVFEVTYEIDLDWAIGDTVNISAHAVVCQDMLFELEMMLPDEVTVSAVHSILIPYYNSYFVTEITNGEFLNGIYDGWCVDRSKNMPDNTPFEATPYSSYETLPAGVVDNPDNLDLINYILNQEYVGEESECDGMFTFGDVQMAIWDFIETSNNPPYPSALGPYDICRIEEIKDDALANGEGYIPDCGDEVVIILYNETRSVQNSIITIPMPCPNCETAWGDGLDFPGSNWAMYFEYIIQ
jgi:hypothetical protein